jgi:hypothetical protein
MNDPLANGRKVRSGLVLLIRWLAPPASIVSALRAGVIQAEPALAGRFLLATEEPGRWRGSAKKRR